MLGRMKIYTVHLRPDLPKPYEAPVFVREGFHWPAFLFTFLWALYQRLWAFAALILLAYGVIFGLGEALSLSEPSLAALQFAIQLLVGFSANDWLRRRLKKRGYVLADITTGEGLLGAQQRFLERYLATARAL